MFIIFVQICLYFIDKLIRKIVLVFMLNKITIYVKFFEFKEVLKFFMKLFNITFTIKRVKNFFPLKCLYDISLNIIS